MSRASRRPTASPAATRRASPTRSRAASFDAFVVPGWALRSYWQAVRACRRRGVPVLVRGDSQLGSQRNGVVRIAKALAFSHLLRRFDGFLYVGQRNREYLLHYGVPAERLFFSPHCVDNDAFAAASSGIRRAEGRRRVLFVGKLIGRKHPADLLRRCRTAGRRGRTNCIRRLG